MSTIGNLRSAAEARLAEIEREAEHLRALVRLYGGIAHEPEHHADGAKPATKGRGRGISPAWKPLGAHLVRRGEAHLDELEALSVQNALGFDRAQIRNQMHNWKRRGFVESPRQSVFVITPMGVAELDGEADARCSNGADHEPAPSPSSENRDEPQSNPARFDLLNPNKAAVPGGGT